MKRTKAKILRTAAIGTLAAAGMLALPASAAEIQYTGGGTAKNLLTDPANWGGTLPGEDDIAIVDLSLTGPSPHVGANWSVKGISFVSGSASSGYWFGKESGTAPTLTIGESGLTVEKAYSFYIQLPVALSADQTWSMGNAILYFTSPATLSGTANWTIANFTLVRNEIALKYGGKIRYNKTYNPVWNTVAGRWAETVEFSGNGVQYERPVISVTKGTTSVSDMFGDRSMNFQSGPSMLNFGNYGHDGACATFSVDSGDAVTLNYNYSTFVGGDLRLTGGTFTPSTYFDLGVNKEVFGTQVSHANAARLLVSGGLLDPVYLGVGRWYAAYADGGSAKRIVQTGGTVGQTSRAYALLVGGGPSTTSGTYPEPLAEYRLEGGTMTFTGSISTEHGLALSCNNDTSVGTIPGVFTQTGGVANVREVQFGSRRNGHWGSEADAKPNYEGFGLLDLAGGTLNLGVGGFQLAPKWNVGGSESNAAYKVRLRGGNLVSASTQVNELAVDVTGAATSTVTVAQGCTFSQDAPLRGSGPLRKAGDGTLVLRDATRFTGDLIVDAGRVVVEGTEPDLDDGALVWTADDATAGLANGDAVTTWSDKSGAYVAESNTVAHYSLLPTVTNNTFNGHAGVHFFYDKASDNSASMQFPGGQNALCGLTNFTVVVVARPSKTESTADTGGLTGSVWLWTDQILGNACNSTPAFFTLQYTKDGADAGCYFGTSGELPRCPVVSDMKKDVTSVIIASRCGNAFEVNVNGVSSNRVYSAYDGTKWSCWNGDATKPLYLACNSLGSNRGFKGDMAEIRIYRDRVLSAAEKESLVLSLLDKYESSADRVTDLRRSRTIPTADGFSDGAAPQAPAADASWDAAALATLEAAPGCARPQLLADEFGGKGVMRFDGTQALVIPSGSSPLSGASAFTAAVVFRTTGEGEGESAYEAGLGLLSTRQADANAPDFLMSWRSEDTVGAGYGATSGNLAIYSFKPCRLGDGEAHVAVFAADPANSAMRMMTDGRLISRALTANETRGAYDVCVGALRSGTGFFKGDIAAVRLYARALTYEEMYALSEAAAADYRFGLMGRLACTAEDLTAHGLAARSVAVAEGATLIVPDSTNGLCLAQGASLSGAGTIIGKTTLADGVAVEVDWNALPMSLGSIAASGTVTVRVLNAPAASDAHGRIELLRIDRLEPSADLVWRIEGLKNAAEPVWDARRCVLHTHILRGMTMIFR